MHVFIWFVGGKCYKLTNLKFKYVVPLKQEEQEFEKMGIKGIIFLEPIKRVADEQNAELLCTENKACAHS